MRPYGIQLKIIPRLILQIIQSEHKMLLTLQIPYMWRSKCDSFSTKGLNLHPARVVMNHHAWNYNVIIVAKHIVAAIWLERPVSQL